VIFKHAYASRLPADGRFSLFAQSMPYSSPSLLLNNFEEFILKSQLKAARCEKKDG